MVGNPQQGTPYEASGLSRPMFVLQDRYEVVNHLGQGGMGTVYVARDRRLGRRQCVVKKLRDDFFRQEDKEKAMSFFEREVLVLSQLAHGNIVRIYDSFKENDDCYLVMEYVEGENLHQMLHRRGEPFPEEQVLLWASQIAEVLDYLHTNDPQIIYRDLKPSNIMIDTKDMVKLVDFGIARPYVEETDNTHVVSAGYSPPEQYWGAADPRSDIYALGATMYFLLTGEEPLALQTSSPRRINSDVSEHTDMIVQRATAQDILMRYQSAPEMREDLDQWKSGTKRKSSATTTAVISIVALIGLVVAGVGATWLGSFVQQFSKTQAEQRLSKKQVEEAKAREEQWKKKVADLERIAQAKLTDEVAPGPAPGPENKKSSTPQLKQATVAFREVDEAQMTDPNDAIPSSQSDPPTSGGLQPIQPTTQTMSPQTSDDYAQNGDSGTEQ